MEADYSIKKKAKPQLTLMIFSATIAALIQYLLPMVSEEGEFFRRLLSPSDSMAENIVPFTITFLWIWTMLDIASKASMAFKQRKHLEELQIAVNEGKGRDISVLDSLHDASKEENYAYRRIGGLITQIKSGGDGRQAHEHFRHQLVIDADQTASGYTLAKVFIWAMPIVGFIGTVVGIGQAVAEFATFLTSKMTVDDIEAVKHALAGVAGGLSYAFDTTLLGLTASIVAMLIMSFVQRTDEGFLSNLEQLGLEVLTLFGFMQQKTEETDEKAEAEQSVNAVVERLTAELNESVGHLMDNITAMGNGFSPLFERISQTIAPLGTKIESSVDGLQQAIQVRVNSLSQEEERIRTNAASLHDSLTNISEKLGHICDALAISKNHHDEKLSGGIYLSEESSGHIKAEVTRLVENVSKQVNLGMERLRRASISQPRTNHEESTRMPWWRALVAGLAIVLLTTVAVSSVVSMQEMRALAQSNQVRDAQFSENLMKIAQSVGDARIDLNDTMASVTQALTTPTAAGVESDRMEMNNHESPGTALHEEAVHTPKPEPVLNSPVVEQTEQSDSLNEVGKWLASAEVALEKNALLTPEGESTIYWVNRVLEVEPHNSKATAIRGEVIDRYLSWAATQLQGKRLQAAKASLAKAETLMTYATKAQQSKLSSLKYMLDRRVRDEARRSVQVNTDASSRESISVDGLEPMRKELSTEPKAQPEMTKPVISAQHSNYDTSQRHGEIAPGEQAQPQETSNPIKALGNLFKRVFKNETASEN